MSAYIHMATAQFENANALRNYPFREGCALVDDLGRRLPRNVIADLRMFVPADVQNGVPSEFPEVRMTSVHLSQSMVSVCFSSKFGEVLSALSVTVAAGNLKPYFPYRMEKLAGSHDIGGVVTFGEMELPGMPETYRFNPSAGNADVHPCCIAACKPAALSVDVERAGKSFRLSLEDGAAAELASRCDELEGGVGVCGATSIKTINGIRPDEDGNIVLWFH